MDPLEAIAMPTHAVSVGLNTANSWPTLVESPNGTQTVRRAYIATNSTQRLSFVSLQSATHPANVLRITSRPSHFDDMPYGLVVEVHLTRDIADNEAVHLSLAHAGATTYYPPQQIDDAP
jgi:hypothetical protein